MTKDWKISIGGTLLFHACLVVFLLLEWSGHGPGIIWQEQEVQVQLQESEELPPSQEGKGKTFEEKLLEDLRIDPETPLQEVSKEQLLSIKDGMLERISKMSDEERYEEFVSKAKLIEQANPVLLKMTTNFLSTTVFSADMDREVKYRPEVKGDFDHSSAIVHDAAMIDGICVMTYLDKDGRRLLFRIPESEMTANDRRLLSVHEMARKNENLQYMLRSANKIIQSSDFINDWVKQQEKQQEGNETQ